MEIKEVFVVLDIDAFETTILGVFRKKEDAIACFKDNRDMGRDTTIETKELIN